MITRRTRAAALLVAAALTVTALAATAGGAFAASRVGLTEATSSHFPDMAFVLSLPKKQPLTAADVAVTENGKPVQNISVAKPGAEELGVVLLIDASNSMKGRPIAGAMAAARAFAARRNPGQPLALVTFNDKATVVLPLTNDPTAIAKALAKEPALANGTHIYDALQTAGSLLQGSGVSAGSIVLLSDGTDVGSKADQETAAAALKAAKIRVFSVGLNSGQYNPETLQSISEATSGTYTKASGVAALSQIYSDLGLTLSNEYLLKYRSLAGPDDKIKVKAKVDGFAGAAAASYQTPALPTSAEQKGQSTWDKILRSPITLVLMVLAIVSAVGWAIFRIIYRPHEAVTQRIGQFVTLPVDEEARKRQEDVAATLAASERGATTSTPEDGWWQRLTNDMAIAGMTITPRAVALLSIVGGLALGIVVSLFVGSPLGMLAFPIVPFIARAIVNRKLAVTRRTFADQLPDNLDVLSSGLRSGHSFAGALSVCVDDADEPSKSEFRRVIADEQLGIPVDEALHITALRMANRDIVQIALVAKLQRDAGTNAAEVLDQVADNVRARLDLRRLVSTLTAQGRMSRWIVSFLPLILFLGIYLLNPDYLQPLWSETVGIIASIIAVLMVVAGSLVIKRIIEIEV